MSSILNTAISGINAMKVMIEDTVYKINHMKNQNVKRRFVLENVAGESNVNNTAVKVKEIYDNYNDFITEEKRKTSAQVTDEETNIEQLLKLEDLLCEKSNIFNELIDDLYRNIELDHTLNKNTIINKDIKEKLKHVIFSLQEFDRKLKFLEINVKETAIDNIQKANSLIDQIHDINVDMRYFPVLRLPNRIENLLDKRDTLVDELNNLIGIKVVKSNENYKLYLNNGICLIDNLQKQNLMPLTSISDNGYISVGYIDNISNQVKQIEDMVPSASLGALLRFRREDLNNAKNKIGQLTVNFANNINEYHTLGYDMFGNFGHQILNISDPENIPSSTNRSSPEISSKWISTSEAKSTDYIVSFTNNNWIVTRLLDHTVAPTEIHQEYHNTSLIFDGIKFSIEGHNADGDVYMVKPYSKTVNQLELLIDENTPLSSLSTKEISDSEKNNFILIKELNQDLFVQKSVALDMAYQEFSESITHKCNHLEEEIPFKTKMVEILHDKKISMSNNIDQDYQELNYQQDCYLANVKVLQTAETIFNEIIECYS